MITYFDRSKITDRYVERKAYCCHYGYYTQSYFIWDNHLEKFVDEFGKERNENILLEVSFGTIVTSFVFMHLQFTFINALNEEYENYIIIVNEYLNEIH